MRELRASFEVTEDRRKRRTVLVHGQPRAVVLPGRQVFIEARWRAEKPKPFIIDAEHVSSSGTVLLAYSADDEGDLETTPLRRSPFVKLGDSSSHVYSGGRVCFGASAMSVAKTDPVRAFWSSSFRVLPAWLAAPGPGPRVAPVPPDLAAVSTAMGHFHPPSARPITARDAIELIAREWRRDYDVTIDDVKWRRA